MPDWRFDKKWHNASISCNNSEMTGKWCCYITELLTRFSDDVQYNYNDDHWDISASAQDRLNGPSDPQR